jgi:hypothetical protein
MVVGVAGHFKNGKENKIQREKEEGEISTKE